MTTHVGYARPTPLEGCSSFKTSEESRMDEHKASSSRGTPECVDIGPREECTWELKGLKAKFARKWSGVILAECEG